MNLMSALVGLSIVGAAAPVMVQMSIAPLEAQKRAQNLGIAEAQAVTFAANNEGSSSFTDIPSDCNLSDIENGAFTVTCTAGEGTKYIQTVSRSFRSEIDGASLGFTGNNNARVYANAVPGDISYVHQCPGGDEWGMNWFNATYGKTIGACTPQIAWTKAKYLASNPDDWLYDINNFQGWGSHPDY